VAANEEEFRKLPVSIAIYRVALAQARGDIAGTARHAQRALDHLQAGDHLGRGGAAGFLGLALWACGEVGAAQRTHAEAMVSLKLAGNLGDVISGAVVLAICTSRKGAHARRAAFSSRRGSWRRWSVQLTSATGRMTVLHLPQLRTPPKAAGCGPALPIAPVQRTTGKLSAVPVLNGLHHAYAWVTERGCRRMKHVASTGREIG
jgi:hypothetical protein